MGLISILQKKFTDHEFLCLQSSQIRKYSKPSNLEGIIVELKSLQPYSLRTIDFLNQNFKDTPKIFILSPTSFKSLNEKKQAFIDHHLIILSELNSIDYLLQLPRLIEEVGVKRRLRIQNERLRRLLEENSNEESKDMVEKIVASREGRPQGLRVTFDSWNRIKKVIGSEMAKGAVSEAFGRLIGSAIRNSDRILHAHENEFLIFLSNCSANNLDRCRERLTKALKTLEVYADKKKLTIPFSIDSIDSQLRC